MTAKSFADFRAWPRILDALSSHYGKSLDRDLLFLGGFLHDIGKLWELSYDRVTDYTTEGKLIGHLVMGVELVERKVRELDAQTGRLPAPFPEEKKLLVKHLILAHHGELEYGSPKRPKCLEALVVHYIDDLDSKVNAIRTFIENDQSPGRWTGLHRMYERFFFKPDWALEMQQGPGDKAWALPLLNLSSRITHWPKMPPGVKAGRVT